jgi:hypothetical protein
MADTNNNYGFLMNEAIGTLIAIATYDTRKAALPFQSLTRTSLSS